MPPPPSTSDVPLCVDLDGTLLTLDTAKRAVLRLAMQKPWLLPALLGWWMTGGRVHAKRKLAQHALGDPATFPVHETFLTYLKTEHAAGRTLILITAADAIVAEAVAAHAGVFSEVIASDGVLNMTARVKARILPERFGRRGFDYAGNAHTDIQVWQVARKAIVVNPASGLLARMARIGLRAEKVFPRERRTA